MQNQNVGENFTLTDDERRALDHLVPLERQTGDLVADLTAAAKEALRRREANTMDGGAVLGALHRDAGSWRRVGAITGIPFTTAQRWAVPPKKDAPD